MTSPVRPTTPTGQEGPLHLQPLSAKVEYALAKARRVYEAAVQSLMTHPATANLENFRYAEQALDHAELQYKLADQRRRLL